MSEYPWEKNKSTNTGQSLKDDSETPHENDGVKKSPKVPDILANAFANTKMEEVEIEIPATPMPEQTEDNNVGNMPQMNVPSFGDVPDISALDEIKNNSLNLKEKVPDTGNLPPFMKDTHVMQDIQDNINKKEDTSLGDNFDINSQFEEGKLSTDEQQQQQQKSGNSGAKRSPPPLFDPFFQLGDEKQDPQFIHKTQKPSFKQDNINITDAKKPIRSPENTEHLLPGNANGHGHGISNDISPSKKDPFTSSSIDPNPFDTPFHPGSNQVDPNTFGTPVSNINPSITPPSSTPNPFDASSSSEKISAVPHPHTRGSSPFGTPPAPSHDPFGSNPFDSNPFDDNDPFAGADSFDKQSFSGSGNGLKDQIISSVNNDAVKRNLADISTALKGFFRSLTKGKSLIERVEDMRDDTSEIPFYDSQKKDINTYTSPFDNEAGSEASNSAGVNKNNHFPFTDTKSKISQQPSDPFSADTLGSEHGDIRRITPVQPMDTGEENMDPFATFPVEDNNKNSAFEYHGQDNIGKHTVKDLADIENAGISHKVHVDPEIAGAEKIFESAPSKKESATPDDLKEGIADLQYSVKNIELQFASIRDEVENISQSNGVNDELSSLVRSNEQTLSDNRTRLEDLEQKIASREDRYKSFEPLIFALQSETNSVRSDISRIEDNVSELVNSYTALLSQLHESLQETEQRFSRMDVLSEQLDMISSKLGPIEKYQEDSRSTSMELSRSISSIVDNMGKMSSELSDFKKASSKKDASMLTKIQSLTEYVDVEMAKVGARSYKGFGQNVHLSSIVKNSSNMKLCMEWLEFLMELVGRNNLPDILSYYEELGWITEKVKMELLHYSEGIDFYMEKPDWKLTPDDHVKSIWFIESLAGMKVDKNRLSVIERDIEKVKKGTEIYGI